MATNLPVQTTSFVGREGEVADIKRLLAFTRLLTLTGTGGCGKTRLALRVADEVAAEYPDGAWLAELAAVADPALVAQAVATAAGVREAPRRAVVDSLLDQLRERATLLLLDNCEHVVDAAARLAEALLRACPGVRILATSREPLRAAGETTWRVPSLTLPTGGAAAEDVARSEAARLFLDRAQAAAPTFALTPEAVPALREICCRLDGIALAIELAAARVRAFSVQQIAARLDDRFELLSAGARTAMPRQQTLRAAVDWSYALLSAPEQAVLRRLAVFAGGWTLEGAEEVAGGDLPALDLLGGLVDKSLVAAEHQAEAVRYRLLETIRQYALERLDEAGETNGARDRHLAHFLALAEDAEPRLRGPEAGAVLARLREDQDNLRSALEWALQRDPEAALRLAGALAWAWWDGSYHTEGRRWLARALAASQGRTSARMRALHGAGWLAHHQRDSTEARAHLVECLSITRELGDAWAEAWALHALGRVAYFEHEPALARSLGEQSLAIAKRIGDDWLIAWGLHLLGLAAYISEDYPTARGFYERSLAIRRELGFQEGIGVLLGLLGLVAIREGHMAKAEALFREGLAEVSSVAGPWGVAVMLSAFALIAVRHGQPVRAVRLGAAAVAAAELYRTPLIPLFEPVLAEGLDLARTGLGVAAYDQAWAEGRSMSFEEAVAEAANVDANPAGGRTRGELGSFTPTERRVLALLATGRTTREIAGELVVATSTVDRHLTHIYGKLGVRNRAEATALAFKHGLAEGNPSPGERSKFPGFWDGNGGPEA